MQIRFVDGTQLDMHCVTEADYAVALWRATGSAAHVEEMDALAAKGLRDRRRPLLASGREARVRIAERRRAVRRARSADRFRPRCAKAWARSKPPRGASCRRSSCSTICAACCTATPIYSDGSATIAEMARAAQGARLELHRHHRSLAGRVLRRRPQARQASRQQHDEIDELNATLDGLPHPQGHRGRHPRRRPARLRRELLDRFDYVDRVGALALLHGRSGDDRSACSRALDDPHLTILGAPDRAAAAHRASRTRSTSRRCSRKPRDVGVAVELNADPHRLDLDWRYLPPREGARRDDRDRPRRALDAGLDNVHFGVGIARKAWLEARRDPEHPDRRRRARLRARSAADQMRRNARCRARRPTLASRLRARDLRAAQTRHIPTRTARSTHRRRSSCWSRRSSARSAPTSASTW